MFFGRVGAVPNADQADLDSDGIGDVCDDAADGDGYVTQEKWDDWKKLLTSVKILLPVEYCDS